MKHDKNEIMSLLKQQQIAVIGTNDSVQGFVRLRIMYYGIDENFNCFLMSLSDSPKVEQILTSNNISMLVFNFEDPYDKSWEAEINGRIVIIRSQEDINTALKELKGRNPFADVASEAGIVTNNFVLMRLKPELLRFRIYGEALNSVSPTVIKFE